MTKPTRTATGHVIGYVRVSTGKQQLSPEHQRNVLEAEAARRGWTIEILEDAGKSGTSMEKRPALAYALDLLAIGKADAIMATKLDRLARSIVDFGAIMQRSTEQGWAVIVLDLAIDTSTPNGELVATIIAAVAQWEARMIADRTRDALGVKRDRGEPMGRGVTLPQDVRERIGRARAHGMTLQAIADELNAASVPTAQGGRQWYPSSVQAVLRSLALEDGRRRLRVVRALDAAG